MASLTTPFLVYNLGCEMLFIIDQRLRAQHSSNERSAAVLLDLADGLLQADLMEAHFEAQPRPQMSHVYELFVKVVNSTVMRLSTTRLAAAAVQSSSSRTCQARLVRTALVQHGQAL